MLPSIQPTQVLHTPDHWQAKVNGPQVRAKGFFPVPNSQKRETQHVHTSGVWGTISYPSKTYSISTSKSTSLRVASVEASRNALSETKKMAKCILCVSQSLGQLVSLSGCPSVHPSVCMPICLSACHSVSLSVSLPVLSVCLHRIKTVDPNTISLQHKHSKTKHNTELFLQSSKHTKVRQFRMITFWGLKPFFRFACLSAHAYIWLMSREYGVV